MAFHVGLEFPYGGVLLRPEDTDDFVCSNAFGTGDGLGTVKLCKVQACDVHDAFDFLFVLFDENTDSFEMGALKPCCPVGGDISGTATVEDETAELGAPAHAGVQIALVGDAAYFDAK